MMELYQKKKKKIRNLLIKTNKSGNTSLESHFRSQPRKR